MASMDDAVFTQREMPLVARQRRVADSLQRGRRLFDAGTCAWLANLHRPVVLALERQALARRRMPLHCADEVQASDAVRALEGGMETPNRLALWDKGVSDWRWAEPAPGADYDDGDGSLKKLPLGVCALGCSGCGRWWLRRVKPIRDRLKGGQEKYHCPNASCQFSSANGPKMEVRKRDFGLEYKASLSFNKGDAPAWEVRLW